MKKILKQTISAIMAVAMLIPAGAVFAEEEKNPNVSTSYSLDFNLEQNQLAYGRWSYINGDGLIKDDAIGKVVYMQRGDNTEYADNEYALNADYGNHTRWFRADAWSSDTLPMAAVYTLDKEFMNAAGGINIKGKADRTRLVIAKTYDKNGSKMQGNVEVLYDVTYHHNFDFTVPGEKFSRGDDLIFWFQRETGNEWWIPYNFDVTIKAMHVPQVETPVMSHDRPDIPYGSEVELSCATEGASIYYTLDGSDPGTSATRILYTAPFALTDHTTVSACAEKKGMERSYVKTRNYIMDYPIRDFMGTCNGTVGAIKQLKWTRFDTSWAHAEGEKGVYNEEYLKGIGERILSCKEAGYTIIPVIAYSPIWAVEQNGYKFTHRLNGDVYEYGPASEDTGWKTWRKVTNRWGEVIAEGDWYLSDKNQLSEEAVDSWVKYCEYFVERFSAPPYNLEYFQIWNEAYPSSGFWAGDMDIYFERVHVPAAKAIQAKGGKVVFGGWPCCGPTSELVELLDRHDAWETIDIHDVHYYPLASMDYLWRAAKERGIEEPCVWQTEMGFTSNQFYPANIFARTLRWAIERGLYTKSNNTSKMFWFANGSPNDPVAYGYNCCIMSGNMLSTNGIQIKAFCDIMEGNDLKKFDNFKTEPMLKPEIEEMKSSASGFMINGNEVIMALNLVKQNSYSNLLSDVNGTGKSINLDNEDTFITIDMKGIKGDAKATRIDATGYESYAKVERIDDETIRVYVPTKDENPTAQAWNRVGSPISTIYVSVKADSVTDGEWTVPTYPTWEEK